MSYLFGNSYVLSEDESEEEQTGESEQSAEESASADENSASEANESEDEADNALEKYKCSEFASEMLISGEFGFSDSYFNTRNKLGKRPFLANVCEQISMREYLPRQFSQVSVAQNYWPNGNGKVVDKYNARVYSGQYSEDGSFFYTCCQDFLVHIYDTSSPSEFKETKVISGEIGRWTITDATLSADNQWIIYSSITPVVYMARTAPDDETQIALKFSESEHATFGLWSIRFSGDAREIVAGASDSSIYVFDVETQTILFNQQGHNDEVNAVCFADPQSSHVLFSGSDDSFVKVWDRRSMRGTDCRPAGVLVGHTEGITFVSSKGDGRYCLTNGKDQTMKLWDIRKMMSYDTFESSDRLDLRLKWDYRFQEYPSPKIVKHPQDCSVMTYTGHRVLKTLIRCHFSPIHSTGQRYLYTGSQDGLVHIFNLEGEVVQILDVGEAIDPSIVGLRRAVARDVSWHPYLPIVTSTSWYGTEGASGTIVQHDYSADNQ
ncbi:WD40 repeat-like protein [Basidiobolus meristosporus CBS 931.73]|uniref:WD40 repeat-like protein n=1 Tax=Basidiobolus meristosporus CBS 931.73 TaxID=1314790 RepID=A0A1Y1Y6B9_9FUNG|nr:WD40 repeat-like protein [Basidiobolus meristosporus CBS 931.73]|eukprot:ORX93571.1 WD40 repeat-like protein [Basidiobolus meristosporus CBS 931.73]